MTHTPRAHHNNNRLIKNLVILYAAQLTTMLLSLVPIAFLPIYLNVAGMGKLSFAGSFTRIFGSLMVMGTANYIVREIAHNRGQLSEIVSSAVVLRLVLAVILLPLVVATLYVSGYPDDIRLVVLIMYGSVTLRMVSGVFGSALQAIENIIWRSAASVMWELVTVVVGWLVLHQGGGVVAYALVIVCANVIEFLINVSYFVLVLPIWFTIRRSAIVQLFRGGLPFFVWVFVQALYMQSSTLLLMRLGGEVPSGWMATASQFIVPLFAIPTVAITVLLPRFSQLHVMEQDAFRHAVARSINYMAVITMPVAVGMCVIADRVIDLFNYAPTFQHSIPVLRILAFTLPGTSLLMVMSTAVSAMKAERAWSMISLFSLVMVLLLNITLIPMAWTYLDNAAIGAAAAFLGAELLTLGYALHRFGTATVDRTTFITFAKTALAAGAMALVVLATAWLPLGIMIVLGGAVYAGAVLLLKVFPPEDLGVVKSLLVSRAQWVVVALAKSFPAVKGR